MEFAFPFSLPTELWQQGGFGMELALFVVLSFAVTAALGLYLLLRKIKSYLKPLCTCSTSRSKTSTESTSHLEK